MKNTILTKLRFKALKIWLLPVLAVATAAC